VDILVIKESSSDRVVERFWKSVGRRKDEGGGEISDLILLVHSVFHLNPNCIVEPKFRYF
jgi:hypothetical protein